MRGGGGHFCCAMATYDMLGTQVHRIPGYDDDGRESALLFMPPCMPWDGLLLEMASAHFVRVVVSAEASKTLLAWLRAQTAYRRLVDDRELMKLFQDNKEEAEMRGSPYAHGTRSAYLAHVTAYYARAGDAIPRPDRVIVNGLVEDASKSVDYRLIRNMFPEVVRDRLDALVDPAVPDSVGYDATMIVGQWIIE